MPYQVRIDGIYDQRTLKHLKLSGTKDYCFEFSPRSFNFIQEHVFLEQIIPLISTNDRLFLHFNRSNDPMVKKVAEDMAKVGVNLENVFFEFDEWTGEISVFDFEYNYILSYTNELDSSLVAGRNFRGLNFEFSFLEDLYHHNLLNRFAANFYTRFGSKIHESHFFIMKLKWDSNIISSLFEIFEFNLIALPINSEIEVCYRNVDLKKLTNEMGLLQKNKLLRQEF